MPLARVIDDFIFAKLVWLTAQNTKRGVNMDKKLPVGSHLPSQRFKDPEGLTNRDLKHFLKVINIRLADKNNPVGNP